ncbi:MAG: hypothetical protein ACUVUD_05450 [bacterium]
MEQQIAVTTGIGRGHLQYLSSVISYLGNVPLVQVSGFGWDFTRFFYRLGGKGGVWTLLYNRLRSTKKPTRLLLHLLESRMVNRLKTTKGTLLVDHPLLAYLLAPSCRVAYLHGEIAAPLASVIPAVWRTFVPLEETKKKLVSYGTHPNTIIVTGLLIEPELLKPAETAFESRLQRWKSNAPLTIAFFLSGASPVPHIRVIYQAARSALLAGNKPFIFCGTDLKTATRLRKKLNCPVFAFSSYAEETTATAQLLPQIDLFVAAAHERTNWAVGLGMPMFVLLPHIGPFSPLNFEFARNQGVCLPLTDPLDFGNYLLTLRQDKKLLDMALAGWGKYPLTGARKVAEYLLSENHNLLNISTFPQPPDKIHPGA